MGFNFTTQIRQIQLDVNDYDREIAGPDDNSTPGILLCTDKNDTVALYVLDRSQEKNLR